MINPDEEDDFVEEYGMEDLGKEWRWPEVAKAANAAARAASEANAASVAEERAAQKASLAADVSLRRQLPATQLSLAEEFYRDGVCVLEEGLTAEQVASCH